MVASVRRARRRSAAATKWPMAQPQAAASRVAGPSARYEARLRAERRVDLRETFRRPTRTTFRSDASGSTVSSSSGLDTTWPARASGNRHRELPGT